MLALHKELLRKFIKINGLSFFQITGLILTISITLWLNVTNQSTEFGNGHGKFADQVDSYSEYLIRNTVINNIVGTENQTGSLVQTKNYKLEDYHYYPDHTQKYFSNRGVQVEFYKWIAKFNEDSFVKYQDTYFKAFRLLNCILITICFGVFFLSTLGKNFFGVLAIIVFSLSGGIALFCANLYFCAWVLFSPLLFYPLLVKQRYKLYVLFALVFSILYFSIRYEFATTFALMWLFPILVQHCLSHKKLDYKLMAIVFLTVIFGFNIALLMHHQFIAHEMNITMKEASALIFSTLKMRVASVTGVSLPFSPGFFKYMIIRMNWVGFTLPLLGSITKFALLLIFIFYAWKEKSTNYLPVFVWAIAAYISWYIFAYQHIMWHAQFDSLIFVATIQLVLVLYLANLVKRRYCK